ILEMTKADIVKVERNRHYQAPEKTIMAALLDYPEIDHEHTGELLYKLALQAVNALREYGISDDNLRTAAFDYRDAIAKRIYDQMMLHFEVEELTFEHGKAYPFSRIEPWNFSLFKSYGRKRLSDEIRPVTDIPKYLFYGFTRACHTEYRFHSKAERDLAVLLEQDKENVL
ncbi:MAG: hypothetical protein KAX50_09935, partial [Saprospiraceae bacterium]|nr:hypothetical protein [Saprospiraceae bacterium]